jgi:DNA mismatch repair protein MLH1
LVALCSKELFYQLLLFDFGNFGALKLSEPPLLYELALLGLDQPNCGWKPEDGSKEEIAEHVSDLLYSKAEMLLDYFSLEISEDKRLVSLPWVLEKYIPDMDNLPNLVLGLSAEVNWETEAACFESFCRQCSEFYKYKPSAEQMQVQTAADEADEADDSYEDVNYDSLSHDRTQGWKWIVEHVLFPAFRTILLPPKKFVDDSTIVEVANLPDLYKVFERC